MAGRISWKFVNAGKVDSTQRVAYRMALSGVPEGLVVFATEQTKGRGRLEREWRSPPGGLYMSAVLRPERKEGLGLLPLLGAFSVVEGIQEAVGVSSLVRWPNDVTIGGKKVAGVIAESRRSTSDLPYVILGVGINCNFDPLLLGTLAEHSTSLSSQLGASVDIEAVRDKTLESFAKLYSRWKEGLESAIFAERRTWFSTLGKKVEVELFGSAMIRCVAERVMDDGSLVAVTDDGSTLVIGGEEILRLKEL